MDSKYTFFILHAYAAIWREKGMLDSKNSPIKYENKILDLPEAI